VACGFFIKLKSCNKRGMDIRIQTGKIYNFKITKIFKKAWRTNIIVNNPDFIEIFIIEHELDFTQFVENDLAILDTLKIDGKRKSMDAGKNRSGNR
jgi:hypothetical protein